MNVRNDLQTIQPTSTDTQISPAERVSSASLEASAAAASDQAHLSSAASLASHTSSVSDVRAEKVQSIQAAIASGSYQVSSADVAQSLMGHMLGNS